MKDYPDKHRHNSNGCSQPADHQVLHSIYTHFLQLRRNILCLPPGKTHLPEFQIRINIDSPIPSCTFHNH